MLELEPRRHGELVVLRVRGARRPGGLAARGGGEACAVGARHPLRVRRRARDPVLPGAGQRGPRRRHAEADGALPEGLAAGPPRAGDPGGERRGPEGPSCPRRRRAVAPGELGAALRTRVRGPPRGALRGPGGARPPLLGVPRDGRAAGRGARGRARQRPGPRGRRRAAARARTRRPPREGDQGRRLRRVREAPGRRACCGPGPGPAAGRTPPA
mmetsp:Transcript_79524/g.225116  ORF Transcript_79524/g.225116 Transcript_79524/m.225116 type:complete len:214 (+) Transcript_79524:120-761(+)